MFQLKEHGRKMGRDDLVDSVRSSLMNWPYMMMVMVMMSHHIW